MSFVEYCESISEQPLPEWQKTYLNKAYEVSYENFKKNKDEEAGK